MIRLTFFSDEYDPLPFKMNTSSVGKNTSSVGNIRNYLRDWPKLTFTFCNVYVQKDRPF